MELGDGGGSGPNPVNQLGKASGWEGLTRPLGLAVPGANPAKAGHWHAAALCPLVWLAQG